LTIYLELVTPHDWGLQRSQRNIFGFRAAIEVSAFQGEQGLVAVDAFDVSEIRWFRLEDVFELKGGLNLPGIKFRQLDASGQ